MKDLIYLPIAFAMLMIMFSCNRKTSTAAVPPSDINDKKETMKAGDTIEKDVAQADLSEEGFIPLRKTKTDNPDTVVMIQTTACYGQCPVYKATILSNGQMFYLGKRHVDKVGYYKAPISPSEIRNIDRKISSVGILDMADRYPVSGEDILDVSNTILLTEFQGQRKKIYINHAAPVKLNDFIVYLENLIKEADWQPANPAD